MNKIVISPNRVKDPDYKYTKIVLDKLYPHDVNICMSKIHEGADLPRYVEFSNADELLRGADLEIVLGGDGSILEAARGAALASMPILGVNLGRVGYMAAIEIEELDLLEKLFSKEYSVEERIMLEARIERDGEAVTVTSPALNEIVLTRGALSRMIDIELFCNDEFAAEYRVDGLIFSTPTGSTAYNMSAGGPVIDPGLDAVAVTPICPHSPNSRPIIFGRDAVFTATYNGTAADRWYVTIDGRENFELEHKDKVIISRSQYITKLMNLKNNGFCDVLRRKTSEKQ